MIEDLELAEFALGALAASAIYPVAWTVRRVRKLAEELRFEDESLN